MGGCGGEGWGTKRNQKETETKGPGAEGAARSTWGSARHSAASQIILKGEKKRYLWATCGGPFTKLWSSAGRDQGANAAPARKADPCGPGSVRRQAVLAQPFWKVERSGVGEWEPGGACADPTCSCRSGVAPNYSHVLFPERPTTHPPRNCNGTFDRNCRRCFFLLHPLGSRAAQICNHSLKSHFPSPQRVKLRAALAQLSSIRSFPSPATRNTVVVAHPLNATSRHARGPIFASTITTGVRHRPRTIIRFSAGWPPCLDRLYGLGKPRQTTPQPRPIPSCEGCLHHGIAAYTPPVWEAQGQLSGGGLARLGSPAVPLIQLGSSGTR